MTARSNRAPIDISVKSGCTVLIADVVGSRRMANRERFQAALIDKLGELGPTWRGIRAGPDLTAGDEWKAAFDDAGSALGFALAMERAFPEVAFRYGFGFGDILGTGRTQPRIGHLDGPAFHHARSAIIESKKQRRYFTFHGFGELGALLSHSLDLAAKTRRDRTEKQRTYILDLQDGATQDAVAQKNRVTGSTVSITLQRARYEEVQHVEEEAIRLLATFWRSHDA